MSVKKEVNEEDNPVPSSVVGAEIKQLLRDLLEKEQKTLALLKKDEELIKKKLNEKDINALLSFIRQQELVDVEEIQQLETEMHEEELLLSEERVKSRREKGKARKLSEEEIHYEIHLLRVVHQLIPLLREKNRILELQKNLLEEKAVGYTLFDLPKLIAEEAALFEKVEGYEQDIAQVLKTLEEEIEYDQEAILDKKVEKKIISRTMPA